ncbi:MAG TPA: NAD(P)H-binding protein [Blastocatellia bacterium]|nr:NAD(P)H-binding protein [Blastocatellia bacterium]HMX25769.1 NAD(P)H-binding protein [Blastocatellia bacterium]HMY70782.1 NAD(P)H-binding protein [Blastocatellia bacterium]HMZ22567.1 NAD(P)H-binding protein [Blastocatellia bacterium]HNG28518.1 NAD(P)H-binding protein [Blastocatellia bacterium]
MNIAIIGASAGVGLKCVEVALGRGHRVITLSRSTESLPKHPNLLPIQGSATRVSDVKNVIQQADAVIVALGTGKSTKPTTLYTDAAAVLIRAQRDLDTNIPFIILTGFGAGNSGEYHGFLMKLLFRLVLKAVYENKTQMEEMIAASSIRWEIVRPGVLNNKPLSGRYRVETDYRKGMNIGAISRSDVADFLVKQAEKPTALGKYPALSNK